jgi:hypothetical protein
MTDKIKTGPGVHPDRQTKFAEPTRRSLFGLSDAKSKGELTVPKQSSKVSEFLDKAERTPHKTERAVEGMLNKPQTRREAMETGKNAVAAARMAGKVKLPDVKHALSPKINNIVAPEHKFGALGRYVFDKAKEALRPATPAEDAEVVFHGFSGHKDIKEHLREGRPMQTIHEEGITHHYKPNSTEEAKSWLKKPPGMSITIGHNPIDD